MDMNPVSARVLAQVLEQRTGQQLSVSRNWRLDVTLDPLLKERGFATAEAVAAAVAGGRDPQLSTAVVEALLNNETSFYRDMNAFRLLEQALPRVIEARRDRWLRVWSAGCSSGQEAYSLAMMLADRPELRDWHVDIVATDVSRAAIDQARQGRYSQFEIQRGLPIRQMMRWFDADGDDWRAKAELRAKVRFQVFNLLDRPPLPGSFDVVLCRNVLLYFAPDVCRTVFDRLGDAIAPDGILLLGAGETVIGQTERFVSDSEQRGLYRPS